MGDRAADARAGAGDERDPARERPRLGHPLQFGLLELPVLDAELLRLRDRCVGRDRLGAAHHPDRVEVELAGDACGLRVLAEAEHADAGHQHDRRVGAAHRRRIGGRRCARSRPGSRRGRPRATRPGGSTTSSTRVARQVDEHRAAPWCAGSGRGTTCRARQARAHFAPAMKSSTSSASSKWPTCGCRSRQGRARRARARPRAVPLRFAAARRSPLADSTERLGLAVRVDEGLRTADDLQRPRLALVARRTPRGDAVAAEDDADRVGMSAVASAISRPSWNPGRRHGTQPTRSPKH